MASVGRANMNTANTPPSSVKAELEGMQKTLDPDRRRRSPISQQRLAADKKDALAYDPQLIADLEKIKLDPRPNTAKIFRVDYFRLPDADVDKLFNYYYDSIALYGEVERHIKKTKADAESLKAYAEKSARPRRRRTTASCSTTAPASSSSPTSSRSAIRSARAAARTAAPPT